MSVVLVTHAGKDPLVPINIREVRLIGTRLRVWFAHSSSGIALGPYADRDEAERRLTDLAAEHLALATLIPFGTDFPETAAYIGNSSSAGHATIWSMSLESGVECCFVMISGKPMAYTGRTLETVDANLKELNRRARRWLG